MGNGLFSTSYSSKRQRETCLRAWWIARYLARQGWSSARSLEDPARLAYVLKHAKGVPGVVGEVVHDVVRQVVDRARTGLPQLALDELGALGLREYARRVDGARSEAWKLNPKESAPLTELFYEDPNADERITAGREQVLEAVEALVLNEHFRRVYSGDVEVIACEELEAFNLQLGDGSTVPVWVVEDLVVRLLRPDSRYLVIDWKTGRVSADVEAQVGLYVAHVTRKAFVPPENVSAVGVFLAHYTERVVPGSAEVVQRALDELRAEVGTVRALLVDGDLERNEPRGPVDEVFPMLPTLSKPCRWCQFRRLCGRG